MTTTTTTMMMMKNMKILCFIIILVSTTFLSINTAVYVLETNDAFFHRILLTSNTTKTDEFSFILHKAPDCTVEGSPKLNISLGSALSGSPPLIYFLVEIMPVREEILVSVTANGTSANDYGKQFVVTLKSLSPIELKADKKDVVKSSTPIKQKFSFDKVNETNLGITFYAWFTESSTGNRCPFVFDFPNYDVLVAKTNIQTTTKVSSTAEPQTSLPPNTVTTIASPTHSTTVKTTTSSSTPASVKTSSTVIYVCVGIGTLFIGIIISAVTAYFVLPKFSYFKPSSQSDTTKNDAEKSTTKLTTFKTSSNQPTGSTTKPSGTGSFSAAVRKAPRTGNGEAAPPPPKHSPAKTPTVDGHYEDVTVG